MMSRLKREWLEEKKERNKTSEEMRDNKSRFESHHRHDNEVSSRSSSWSSSWSCSHREHKYCVMSIFCKMCGRLTDESCVSWHFFLLVFEYLTKLSVSLEEIEFSSSSVSSFLSAKLTHLRGCCCQCFWRWWCRPESDRLEDDWEEFSFKKEGSSEDTVYIQSRTDTLYSPALFSFVSLVMNALSNWDVVLVSSSSSHSYNNLFLIQQ